MIPFITPSRAQILAVACPVCGANPGEACRRDDGKSHAPRVAQARAALTRQRTNLRDAKAMRIARDWLRP